MGQAGIVGRGHLFFWRRMLLKICVGRRCQFMDKREAQTLFAHPKARQLLAVIGMLWLALSMGLAIAIARNEGLLVMDPLVTPFFYLILFGGGSLWVLWRYRRRHIDWKILLGHWPQPVHWPPPAGAMDVAVYVLPGGFSGFVYAALLSVSRFCHPHAARFAVF